MNARTSLTPVRLALPKGRMCDGLTRLLDDAGVRLTSGSRNYRPRVSLDGFEAKLLKPQSIIEMLQTGSRDVGFAGADWVAELDAQLVEVLDTGLDPVRLVAAAPVDFLENGGLPQRSLVVASEYGRLTQRWILDRGLNARFVRSYGATEVFPPEDADCIVDNTATGSTLRANGLAIVDELMQSTTRMYACPAAMDDPSRRQSIEDLALLLRGVLEARRRVLIEFNVDAERLQALLDVVPCMREPTVNQLASRGYAIRVAILRDELPSLIPRIRTLGGTDILVSAPDLIVPGGAA